MDKNSLFGCVVEIERNYLVRFCSFFSEYFLT